MTDRWHCLLGLLCGDMLSVPPHARGRQPTIEDVRDLLKAAGVKWFTAEEVCQPSQPDKARALGLTWLVPPTASGAIRLVAMVRCIAMPIRELVAAPVTCTGLYRPEDYNTAVGGEERDAAKGKPGSAHMMIDHDGAEPAGIDLVFKAVEHRGAAQTWVCDLARTGWIDVGMGVGLLKLHVDLFHGRDAARRRRAPQRWDYASLSRGQRRDPP